MISIGHSHSRATLDLPSTILLELRQVMSHILYLYLHHKCLSFHIAVIISYPFFLWLWRYTQPSSFLIMFHHHPSPLPMISISATFHIFHSYSIAFSFILNPLTLFSWDFGTNFLLSLTYLIATSYHHYWHPQSSDPFFISTSCLFLAHLKFSHHSLIQTQYSKGWNRQQPEQPACPYQSQRYIKASPLHWPLNHLSTTHLSTPFSTFQLFYHHYTLPHWSIHSLSFHSPFLPHIQFQLLTKFHLFKAFFDLSHCGNGSSWYWHFLPARWAITGGFLAWWCFHFEFDLFIHHLLTTICCHCQSIDPCLLTTLHFGALLTNYTID